MLLGFPLVIWLATAIVAAVTEANLDWQKQLEALGTGDRVALARIRRLITGQLAKMRAQETREGWDDLAQEIVVRVWRSHRDGKIRDYRALPGFVRTADRILGSSGFRVGPKSARFSCGEP